MKNKMSCVVVFIGLFINTLTVAEDFKASKYFFDPNAKINREDYHKLNTSKINFTKSSDEYPLQLILSFSMDNIKQYLEVKKSRGVFVFGKCFLSRSRGSGDFNTKSLFLTNHFVDLTAATSHFNNKSDFYLGLAFTEEEGEKVYVPKGAYLLDCEVYVKNEVPQGLSHMITVHELN